MNTAIDVRKRPRLTIARMMALVALAACVAACCVNLWALLILWIVVHVGFGIHLLFEMGRWTFRHDPLARLSRLEKLARATGVLTWTNWFLIAMLFVGRIETQQVGLMLYACILFLSLIAALLAAIWCIGMIYVSDGLCFHPRATEAPTECRQI